MPVNYKAALVNIFNFTINVNCVSRSSIPAGNYHRTPSVRLYRALMRLLAHCFDLATHNFAVFIKSQRFNHCVLSHPS